MKQILLKYRRSFAFVLFALILASFFSSPAHAALGDFLYKWGAENISPKGVAVDSSGNVYVADSGNNRVEVFSSTGVFLRRWGTAGTGDGQFSNLLAIAIDSNDDVYVTEIGGNSRVQVFSKTGTFLRKWGSSGDGDGQFKGPIGIAFDSSGKVYITDLNNYRVQVFNSNGDFLFKFPTYGPHVGQYYPKGIALDSSGKIYVTDSSGYIQVYTNTGTFLSLFAGFGSGDGQLSSPGGIAVGADGNLYVADMGNRRIQVFDSEGNYLRKWGSPGTGDGQFYAPYSIALDTGGNVLVGDSNNNRVQVFSSTGTFVREWGSASSDGSFNAPRNLTVDTSGNIYVSDTGFNRVQVFDTTTAFVNEWYSQLISPSGVALDSSGNVYVTDTNNHRVQVFSSDGSLIRTWGGQGSGNGQFSYPYGIALDSSDNVYVYDWNNRVQKFTSDGTFTTKWGGNGTGDGKFLTPYGCIAIDRDGYVYVSDASNNRIQKFTSNGMFITKWGGSYGSNGSGDGQLHAPIGIAIDAGGTVYVADVQNYRIQAFDTQGTFLGKWGTSGTGDGQFNLPYGVAAGADGKVYVADRSNNRIQVFEGMLPPSTTMMISCTSGLNGWCVSDAVVSLTATDSGSGVKEIYYNLDGSDAIVSGSTTSFSIVSEGTHTVYYYYAKDNAGRTETNHHDNPPRTIKIDKTPPIITATPNPLPNANGWNNTDVTISFTCSDTVSGILSCPTSTTLTAETPISGQAITGTAVDAAGIPATTSINVKIDKTPPVISICYTPGAVPAYMATDSLSGKASESAAPLSCGNTNGVEVCTYTVNAADKADNTARLTAVYTETTGK